MINWIYALFCVCGLIIISAQDTAENLRGGKRMSSMKDLGALAGTDKILHHGYDRYYPFFLEKLRKKPIRMLEIGFLGGSSFKMWCDYFPRGEIFIMDKDGVHHDYPQRVKDAFFSGDQGNLDDLSRMVKEKQMAGALDFIIDDGSHHPEHQKISLKYLFETALKPGGIYIIEDIEMNYWATGDTYGKPTQYGKNHPDSLINLMKGLADSVNTEFLPGQSNDSGLGRYIDEWTSGVFFGHNCVVIVKKSKEEKARFTRSYRHADKMPK